MVWAVDPGVQTKGLLVIDPQFFGFNCPFLSWVSQSTMSHLFPGILDNGLTVPSYLEISPLKAWARDPATVSSKAWQLHLNG